MATESEILAKLNDMLARYDTALSVDGGSKILTLARAGGTDTAAVVIQQGGAERWRMGQFGADAFELQRTPTGALLDYTAAISVNRTTGAVTISGNVGLGVAPSVALHVGGAGRIRNDFLANAAQAAVFQDATGTLWRNDQVRYGSGGPIFHSSAGEAMRVTATGVGIGTSSPGVRLDVVGAIRSTHTMTITSEGGYESRIRLIRSDTGTEAWLGIPSWNPSTFFFYGPTASGSEIAAIYGAGEWQFRSAGSERMRIVAAGMIGINTSNPNAAAALDIASTTRGFLPPRMTTTQRNAISSPPDGLVLYNTTAGKLQVRAGGAWADMH